MAEHVRPTLKALNGLGLKFPPLHVPLHDMKNRLVRQAQKVPDAVEDGRGQKIHELEDRAMFKVRTNIYRGAVEPTRQMTDRWWLVAAGRHHVDSAGNDFYQQTAANYRARQSAEDVPLDVFGPTETDYRRRLAENATRYVVALREAVRTIIAEAASSGITHTVQRPGGAERISALVQTNRGETRLSVMFEGMLDPQDIAIALDAIPGAIAEEWDMTRPAEVPGAQMAADQIVYSTVLAPDSPVHRLITGAAGP